MGSEYKKIEEHYKNKFNNKLIYNTDLKRPMFMSSLKF